MPDDVEFALPRTFRQLVEGDSSPNDLVAGDMMRAATLLEPELHNCFLPGAFYRLVTCPI